MCFALAKELEDLSQFDRSFDFLTRGCSLKRRTMRYAVEDDIATLDRIIDRHNATAIQGLAGGLDTDEPIFIIGLPRSGTTLVEQILARHSEVTAAGETQALALETVRAAQRLSGQALAKADLVMRSLDIAPVNWVRHIFGQRGRRRAGRLGSSTRHQPTICIPPDSARIATGPYCSALARPDGFLLRDV